MPANLRPSVFTVVLLAAALIAPATASARPGALDPGFGTDGVSVTEPPASTREVPADVTEAADGGLVVAGSASSGPGSIVFKYLANGRPDLDFGAQGQARSAGQGWEQVEVQADGKVVLAAGHDSTLTLARLNGDGSPDTTFGGTGQVTLSTDGLFTPPEGVDADASISSLTVLADGSLRAAGSFAGCKSDGYNNCAEAFVAGVDSDGNPETVFGAGGVKNIGFAGNGIASVTLADGRTLVLRNETGDPPYGDVLYSTAVSATGTPDPPIVLSRGDNYYWSTLDEYPGGVTIDAAGRVLFTDGAFLWRLLPDGDRDPDFGQDGRVLLRDLTQFIPGYPGFNATGVTVDSQDRILISGGIASGPGKDEWAGDTWASTGAAARLNPDGSIDNSFGGGGLQVLWHGKRANQHLVGDTSIEAGDGSLVVSGLGPADEGFGFTLARAADDEMEMPTCGGKTAQYVGTSTSDRIQAYGTVVATLGGNDQIEGGMGNTVCAGPGADSVNLKRGPSTVYGGAGNDRITLGYGANLAHGGPGNDWIKGSFWRDRLFGDAGKDLLLGGDRDDRLFGGAGNDRLFGQGGRDWLFGGGGKDRLEVGPVKPDPTDYLPVQSGGFMRVTTLGRKASTVIRLSMVCQGREDSPSSFLTMRNIKFDPATGVLSNMDEEQPSLDDDFVQFAQIRAKVVGNRITGRFRYIDGESYYDHYICRTGSGTLVKKSILKDAWVSFSAKAEPKPRQLAKQD